MDAPGRKAGLKLAAAHNGQRRRKGTGVKLRRAVLGTAIVLFVAAMPAGADPMPGAGAGAFQLADAAWIVPEDKQHGTFYFAMAMRFLPSAPNGMETIGVVGKGRCFSTGNRHHGMTVCSATGRGQQIDPMDFELDPLLRSARLTLEARGFTHVIDWTGQGDAPQAGAGASGGSTGVSAGVDLARWARASGEVFGLELSPRQDVFSFLVQGVMADAWLYTTGYTFHDDGRITLRRSFRH